MNLSEGARHANLAGPHDLFPIMSDTRPDMAGMRRVGCRAIVIAIPWKMIQPHEKQAMANHSQTLMRLAERGGLGATEALDVLRGNTWSTTRIPEGLAHADLAALVALWEDTTQ